MGTKCMIFWLRKGTRVPKMQGLASAAGSVLTLDTFFRAAREGRGRLFIVDGRNAADGRDRIARWRKGESVAGMCAVLEGPDRIVAIGTDACLAVGGASFKAQVWDARIASSQGRVTVKQSRALDGAASEYSLATAFGQGLGKPR